MAEDITSRFLNVISLFNGMIPLIAIQMNALTIGDQVGLVFTTVLDQVTLGMVDEDEEAQEVTDRNYWEKHGSKETVAMVDDMFELARSFDPELELKYNKFYIGLEKNGHPNNFVVFRPKKTFVRVEPRLKRSEETQERLEQAGLDVMDYDDRWGRYRIRLSPGEFERNKEVLSTVLSEAFHESNS